jgi:preprotein translocase subunit YajC
MTGVAWAAGGPELPAGLANLGQFIPLILIFVVFYFLLIRPQQKKAKEHQNYLANLKKGDKVITGGGIHGQITGITDSVVTLEIAENVRIKINRGAIAGAAADADKAQAPAKTGG